MSSNQWLRYGTFGALGLMLFTGACDVRETPSPRLLEPTFQVHEAGAKKAPKKIKEKKSTAQRETQAARLIGAEGGTLEFRGHRITVPAGAVREPTVFKVARGESGHIEVDLRAIRQKANGKESDVGALGFARPIMLELSYGDAEPLDDVRRLAIGWVRDDGSIEVLPSVLDAEAKIVRGYLEHFSKYAMVAN